MMTTLKQSKQSFTTFFRRQSLSSVMLFGKAAASGIIGIAILTGFAATVLSVQALATFLPIAVAFNSAFCGYALAEAEEPFLSRKSALLTMAILLALTGSALLFLIYPWSLLFLWKQLLICAAAAIALCYSGAWLADKNRKLQSPTYSPSAQKEERHQS